AMMERSSRFISLSGLSGVLAGVYALIGAWLAHSKLQTLRTDLRSEYLGLSLPELNHDLNQYFVVLAILVLSASLLTGFGMTHLRSRKTSQKLYDKSAIRMMVNIGIPLIAGGIFIIALYFRGFYSMMASSTLLFYGLALLNGSKYTVNDIRYLGICEIVLGLLAAFNVGDGLIYWAIGFGVLHILYGSMMYWKYERKRA
ncbi:MAG: hypothetical protein ACI9NN_002199, partial [Bacteroidia bacterium]